MDQAQLTNEIAAKIGLEWQVKMEPTALAKTKTSTLVAALGSADNLFAFIGLGHLQAGIMQIAQKPNPSPDEVQFMNELASQVSDVLMFCVEKVSTEIDRRFPV